MKWQVIQPMSRDLYDQSLYHESARRVVFKNCMGVCELDDTTLPNFNKNFYYNQKEAQACLQDCVNTRTTAHFGETNAKKYGLLMDFAVMKKEYQNYERWNPQANINSQYMRGVEEDNINKLVGVLRQKSTAGKYDFQ